LLKLPPEIQLGIRERKISMGHARALVAIEDPKQQLSLYNQILSSEMSVRQVEEATRKNKQPESSPARSAKAMLPAELKAAINSLHKRLEVPVDIKTTQDGKGQLNIRFNSPEELAQLLSKLIP
jgi:ParB family chromosome partitioning protein